jgi:hypothetical protein
MYMQALSIRPDILSPAAMNELQRLCDKVPSYPTPVAMKVNTACCLWLRCEAGPQLRIVTMAQHNLHGAAAAQFAAYLNVR